MYSDQIFLGTDITLVRKGHGWSDGNETYSKIHNATSANDLQSIVVVDLSVGIRRDEKIFLSQYTDRFGGAPNN